MCSLDRGHLGSATEVVIVEGRVHGTTRDRRTIDPYDRKYDWNYVADP